MVTIFSFDHVTGENRELFHLHITDLPNKTGQVEQKQTTNEFFYATNPSLLWKILNSGSDEHVCVRIRLRADTFASRVWMLNF